MSLRKTKQGVVVSDKMDKTIVVRVESAKAHPRYGKIIRTSQKFKAHDENNKAKVGDEVLIMETRPLSKQKSWRLLEIKGVSQNKIGENVEVNEANIQENV